MALDGFDLNTVHKLSSKEKNLCGAGIQTEDCWVESQNASSVLCSRLKFIKLGKPRIIVAVWLALSAYLVYNQVRIPLPAMLFN